MTTAEGSATDLQKGPPPLDKPPHVGQPGSGPPAGPPGPGSSVISDEVLSDVPASLGEPPEAEVVSDVEARNIAQSTAAAAATRELVVAAIKVERQAVAASPDTNLCARRRKEWPEDPMLFSK